ncbi:MAG TPA: sulfotransferase [Bacillales bacterium]
MAKQPNFFIVGAAKSGTTSLFNYLKQHPEVFRPAVKEPKYFTSSLTNFPHNGPGDQRVDSKVIKDFDDYLQIFENAEDEKAIGESSVDYLYYKESADLIHEAFPDAKIIIMLRNPVDRAFSAYLHLTRDSRETLSFEEGLQKEAERKRQNYEFLWHYKSVGMYYEQVRKYIEAFGSDRVRIYLFEDLQNDLDHLLRDVFTFLGVDPDIKPEDTKPLNFSGIPKSKRMEALMKPSRFQGLKKVIRTFLPKKFRSELLYKLRRSNLQKIEMQKQTRKELIEVFRSDVNQLEQLIDRDLSSWLKP